MEKDGLVALGDENVVSFSSNKEGRGFHVGWWGLPSFWEPFYGFIERETRLHKNP